MNTNNNKTFILTVDTTAIDSFTEPSQRGTPERNLLMAILERAILDYVGNDQKELEQATQWIFSDLDDEQATEFSFPWVCQQLDLDTANIANMIKAMPKRGSNRVAPWYFDKAPLKKPKNKVNTQYRELRMAS